MLNKKNILGINVDNYSLKDMMLKVDNFLNNTILNTIHVVNLDTIMDATDNRTMRKCIEALDLSVIVDEDILSAIGVETEEEKFDIAKNSFVNELLAKVEKSQSTVYVVGSNEEVIDRFVNTFNDKYQDIKFVGRQVFERETVVSEAVVNEINSCMPDVIISLLKSPDQEEFITENKDMLSATLWLGLGCMVFDSGRNDSLAIKLKKFIYKIIIKWKIYNI